MSEFERAKQYIKEYLIREFEDVSELDTSKEISLLYTECDNEDYGIYDAEYQVWVDLNKLTLTTTINDVVAKVDHYDSLKELNDCVLECMNSDNLYDLSGINWEEVKVKGE